MRDFHEAYLERAVLHQVMPRQNRLTLSEADMPLTDASREFLTQLTVKGVRDGHAKAADFDSDDSKSASVACNRLLRVSNRNWLRESQGLAKKLFEASKTVNASDGTFAVLSLTGIISGSKNQLVSLLKLDPGDVFRPVEETDEQGRLVVRLEIESDVLPRTAAGIQKCAFVSSGDLDLDYRILAVDRQNEGVADFFLTKFLGAELVLDPKERTERLYRSLKQGRNEVASSLTSTQLNGLDQVVAGAVVATKVDVDALIQSLPIPEKAREVMDAKVSSALPDRQFDLDRSTADSFLRRTSFEGDNGLRVSGPTRFFNQMVKVTDVPNTKPTQREVVITTRKWKER